MLCGVNNTYRNETIDLTTRPNLYYLNALDLLNPVNMLYAKSVCVADCPGEDSVCGTGSMPCTNDTQYRCVCVHVTRKALSMCGQEPGVDSVSCPTSTLQQDAMAAGAGLHPSSV
jgi:hypothetical protein